MEDRFGSAALGTGVPCYTDMFQQGFDMTLRATACLLFALAGVLTSPSSIANEIAIRSETTLAVSSSVGGRGASAPLDVREDAFALPLSGERRVLRKSFQGDERSQCRSYGRASSGTASTSARLLPVDSGFLIDLTTEVTSQGGHYRTCNTCALGTCIGIHGNDTERTVIGTASSRIYIEYPAHDAGRSYELTLKPQFEGDRPNRSIEVILSNGEKFALDAKQQRPILLTPGTTTQLVVRVTSLAKDVGGCCQSKSNGSLSIQGKWNPLPDLLSQPETSTVGRDTGTPYNAVGLLVSANQLGEPLPLCVGTIVGRRSILTAARCQELSSLDAKLSKGIWFVPGNSMREGLANAIRVSSWSAVSNASPTDRSERSSASNELVVGYLERELKLTRARVSTFNVGPDLQSGIAISFFPDAPLVPQSSRPLDWVRKATPVTFRSGDKEELRLAQSRDGNCLRGSGAPIFSQTSGQVDAILVSLEGKCESQVPVLIKDRLGWLGAVEK